MCGGGTSEGLANACKACVKTQMLQTESALVPAPDYRSIREGVLDCMHALCLI